MCPTWSELGLLGRTIVRSAAKARLSGCAAGERSRIRRSQCRRAAGISPVPFVSVRVAVAWDQDWEKLWRADGLVLAVEVLTPPFDTGLPEDVVLFISSCGFGPDPRPGWEVRKVWYSCTDRHCAPEDAEVLDLAILESESMLSELARLTGRALPADAVARFRDAVRQVFEGDS